MLNVSLLQNLWKKKLVLFGLLAFALSACQQMPDDCTYPNISIRAESSPKKQEVYNTPKLCGSAPLHANHELGAKAVQIHKKTIEHVAKKLQLDANLIRAIMYVENAQGGTYGQLAEVAGIAKSILPMNIREDLWQKLLPGKSFHDPQNNIMAGGLLIKRLTGKIRKPTVAKVATLYNSLSRKTVSFYGARVATVYKQQPWN